MVVAYQIYPPALIGLKVVWFHSGTLLGMNSSNVGDADLNRLYAATSLMQIDDNIMR